MMDWNHDGKHDWQDHAFYNNVINDHGKTSSPQSGGSNGSKNQHSSTGSFGGSWMVWLFVLWIISLFLK